MSEKEETWPVGMSIRSRKQMQRDGARDRQRHTRGWYLDDKSFVEGEGWEPRERGAIHRIDWCVKCGSRVADYGSQWCRDCGKHLLAKPLTIQRDEWCSRCGSRDCSYLDGRCDNCRLGYPKEEAER